MFKSFIFSLAVLMPGAGAFAVTCQTQCNHSTQRNVLTGDAHADHGEFALRCHELGGTNVLDGSYLYCYKWESYTTIESGSGPNNAEATIAGWNACRSQSCTNSGHPPWCSGDYIYHSASPGSTACN